MSWMDDKCLWIEWVCRAFRHDRVITRPGETQCGSLHVGLSNTSNCAVKPLFSVLLGKVYQLAETERSVCVWGGGAAGGEELQIEVLSWSCN